VILLISASQVARIIGMSHQHLERYSFSRDKDYSSTKIIGKGLVAWLTW
jgi:hypothetical protein